MKFKVEITYNRKYSNTPFKTIFEVEANNVAGAKNKARFKFKDDWRRSASRIRKISIVETDQPIVTPPTALVIGKRYIDNTGSPFTIVAEFAGLRKRPQFVIEGDDGRQLIVDRQQIERALRPRETVEYVAIYPNDQFYRGSGPVKTSSYGVDQLIQVKVTKVNGKITKKELV